MESASAFGDPPTRRPGAEASGAGSVAVGGDSLGSIETTVNIFPDEPIWPVRVGLIPRVADSFLIRAEGGQLAPGEGPRVLSGMAGVGKTQIAAYLATRLWEEQALDLIVWISATSRQTIIEGYAQAAVDAGVRGADGRSQERDAARFHAWLSATQQRWLIVLDDLTLPANLQQLWPPIRPTGRAVITTRLRDAALAPADVDAVEVGAFAIDEAAQYVRNRLRESPRLADDVDGLIRDLGCLPLALSQSCAFMVDEDVACSEFRARLADRYRHLEELVPAQGELPDDYKRTVAATLSISIEAADRSRPQNVAYPLLQFASLLDPAGIPMAVFISEAARNWLGHVSPGSMSEPLSVEVIRSGLRCLHRFSLVNARGDTVTIHALVQRIVRDGTDPALAKDVAWAVADALLYSWPAVERDRPFAATMRANVAALRAYSDSAPLHPDLHPIVRHSLKSEAYAGSPDDAVLKAEQLVAELERLYSVHEPSVLHVREGMAALLSIAGEHARAQAALTHLLNAHSGAFSALDNFRMRNNLAVTVAEGGDPQTGASMLRDLFGEASRDLGVDHPEVLRIRSNLAAWERRTNAMPDFDASKADDLALAEVGGILAERMRVLGPDHIDTLRSRNNLATTLCKAGEHVSARSSYEELVASLIRVLGPDHPRTFETRANLCRELDHVGESAAAVAAFEDLLTDSRRVFGPEHPTTFDVRAELVRIRGESGDVRPALAEADELFAEAIKRYGETHPRTLKVLYPIPKWRLESGDRVGALAAFDRLYPLLSRVAGPNHHETLAVLRGLSMARHDAGDNEGAVAAAGELVTQLSATKGPDAPETLETRRIVAQWRLDAGDADGSLAELEALFDDVCRVLGPAHTDTLTACRNFANLRRESGDPSGAVAAIAKLLDMQADLGDDDPAYVATRNDYGWALARAGQVSEALRIFNKLLDQETRPDLRFLLRGNIASAVADSGDLASSITMMEGLLADITASLGPDNDMALQTRFNLAGTLAESGDDATARRVNLALYNDLVRLYGPLHARARTIRARLAHGGYDFGTDGL
jgi:tetratricopeptide (TPR) repeat protein